MMIPAQAGAQAVGDTAPSDGACTVVARHPPENALASTARDQASFRSIIDALSLDAVTMGGCATLFDELDRGEARYVVAHENGAPAVLVLMATPGTDALASRPYRSSQTTPPNTALPG
jgi:hypothetical protein